MGPSRPGRARPCRGCRGRTATMGSGRGRGWGGGGPGAGRPAGSARRPPRRVRSFAGACGPLVLPADLCERLRALGREQGATLFMVLLAGFYALLQRYSGQDDLVVGSAIAGRQRPELEGLIGFFVNTLVLRCRPERRRGFRELVARVRELTLAAYAHQDLPFEILVERLQPERQLRRWNQTAAPYPHACLHQLIEAQAERSPRAPALRYRDQQLSYQQLERRANQLAHQLQGLGVGPDDPVALCHPRGPQMLISLLAILKAGGAYLPLDPSYPPQRLAYMLNDARPKLLLTNHQLASTLPHHHTPTLDPEQTPPTHQPNHPPNKTTTPDNLAYLIYTS